MFRSLRWRLSLSYAGIALLTALAIGFILIITLRGYYAQLEHEYLMNNAMTIGRSVADMMSTSKDLSIISDQIGVLSFLSQTRIRVLDANQQTMTDTGRPESSIQYTVQAGRSQAGAFVPGEEPIQIFTAATGPARPSLVTRSRSADGRTDLFTILIPATAPLSGVSGVMGVSSSEDVFYVRPFSDQKATLSIFGAQGQTLGYVELSEGPAYGSQIVASVVRSWVAASLFGILLAGASGWWVSRRITRPLLALTEVTSQMADGDLATRADISTGDEFETLAYSFNEMAQRVEQTVTALKRFVADAAHELDTPLTALRTNLELIVTAQETGQPEHIREGLAQVRRLETLTHGLLDLSRIEARREKVEPVDIVALVRRVCEVAASRAEQAGLSFEVETPPTAPQIQGNEALLERAVMNLLDNALKFTPSGGSIRLQLEDEPDRVAITVEDTGIGIPEDELPLLFSRFHRARNVAGYPGNGLGLAIVHAIVASHEGEISAKAGEAGTRFTIWLPQSGRPEKTPGRAQPDTAGSLAGR